MDKHRADQLRKELVGFQAQSRGYESKPDLEEQRRLLFGLRGDVLHEINLYLDDDFLWFSLPYFVGTCMFYLGLEEHRIDNPERTNSRWTCR